jgi:hypothetical protein
MTKVNHQQQKEEVIEITKGIPSTISEKAVKILKILMSSGSYISQF